MRLIDCLPVLVPLTPAQLRELHAIWEAEAELARRAARLQASVRGVVLS